jgi:hypothetical protein
VVATLRSRNGTSAGETRKVALVTRVSTDRQAMNEEGSLKTQLQRLRAHIEYKNGFGRELDGIWRLRPEGRLRQRLNAQR